MGGSGYLLPSGEGLCTLVGFAEDKTGPGSLGPAQPLALGPGQATNILSLWKLKGFRGTLFLEQF
jgi:hypothetical protein